MHSQKFYFALKAFTGWLAMRKKGILGVFLFFGIFALVYTLYGYDWGVFLYAALLCTVLCLVGAIIDFYRFYNKHLAYVSAQDKLPLPDLPLQSNLLEKDLEQIIEALQLRCGQIAATAAQKNKESEDYYTLWVHQVKTPIAAIRLLLQSRNAAQIPLALRETLEQELFSIEQYAGMALQYQRISGPSTDLQLSHFAMDKLAKKAVKNMAQAFILKNIPVKVDAMQQTFVTDEKWFVFMLEQLLSNASKYTNKGLVHIFSPDKNVLCIQDTGIGIRPQDLPLIFERGYTGQNGHASSPSTGLGLYLCRQIADLLGLELSATSAVGKGTTIRITVVHRALMPD